VRKRKKMNPSSGPDVCRLSAFLASSQGMKARAYSKKAAPKGNTGNEGVHNGDIRLSRGSSDALLTGRYRRGGRRTGGKAGGRGEGWSKDRLWARGRKVVRTGRGALLENHRIMKSHAWQRNTGEGKGRGTEGRSAGCKNSDENRSCIYAIGPGGIQKSEHTGNGQSTRKHAKIGGLAVPAENMLKKSRQAWIERINASMK